MTSSKRKSLPNRVKGVCMKLLLKMALYIWGVSVVLILIISAITGLKNAYVKGVLHNIV